MNWTIAKNDGGRDTGFHDAGVETFKGNFDRYLARELIQNSLDARLDSNKPVRVIFEKIELNRTDIPDIDALKATFSRCAEYWSHDKKASSFFKEAEKIAKGSKVTALRIGDYNTSGVVGGDTDRQKNWYNLIRCAGSSSKAGGEGGSFGIGKNAPFAASLMRTVLYSTLNKDREWIFQGVAMLVSHKHPTGGIAQATGYLGGEKGASIRAKSQIPEKFLRKEKGTDIVIVGFHATENWQNDLVFSVLDNFWPAIQFDDLEVTVGTDTITSESLPDFLQKFSTAEDFTAHLYFDAFKNPSHPFNANLPSLKDVSLYVKVGENDLPKKITMVRKTGMKIFEKAFRAVMPYCGVFLCRSEAGNSLLREMEPPRHDNWDPNHPEKGANKKTEAEYVSFIRDCLKKLAPVDESKVITIPGLSKFLPDDDETPEETFGGTDEDAKQETPERRPLPQKINGQRLDPRRRHMQPDGTKPRDGEYPTEADDGEGSGGAASTNTNEAEGGTGKRGGGQGEGNAGASAGALGGVNSEPAVPIQYRTFSRNSSAGVYAVTVTPQKKVSKDVNLVIWSVGDDQRAGVEIASARLSSGADAEVKYGCVVGPIKMPKDGLSLEILLKEPLRIAMEVSAHEA